VFGLQAAVQRVSPISGVGSEFKLLAGLISTQIPKRWPGQFFGPVPVPVQRSTLTQQPYGVLDSLIGRNGGGFHMDIFSLLSSASI